MAAINFAAVCDVVEELLAVSASSSPPSVDEDVVDAGPALSEDDLQRTLKVLHSQRFLRHLANKKSSLSSSSFGDKLRGEVLAARQAHQPADGPSRAPRLSSSELQAMMDGFLQRTLLPLVRCVAGFVPFLCLSPAALRLVVCEHPPASAWGVFVRPSPRLHRPQYGRTGNAVCKRRPRGSTRSRTVGIVTHPPEPQHCSDPRVGT